MWAVPANGSHVATPVTYGVGAMPSLDIAKNGSVAAFVRVTSVSPGDLFVLPAVGGEPRQLTHWATQFEGIEAPTEVSYLGRDGLYIHGYLFTPPGECRGKNTLDWFQSTEVEPTHMATVSTAWSYIWRPGAITS